MKTVRKSPSQDDKVSWWYWFEKLDGNRAKCKNCEWLRDRGPAKSTSILRCHLKSKHSELYDQRMEAQATTPNPEQRGRKRTMTTPTTNGAKEGAQQRRQQRRTTAKSMLAMIKTAPHDDEYGQMIRNDIAAAEFCSNFVDHSSPKFAISDHFNEKQIPNFMPSVDTDNGSLKESLGLSHAMLSMFMNTLGDNNVTSLNDMTDVGACDQYNNNNIAPPSIPPSSAKKRQCSSKRFTTAPTKSDAIAASSNLIPNSSGNSNNENNDILPTSSLSMLMQQSSVTANAPQRAQQQQPIVKMCRVETFSAAHRLHNDNLPDYLNREVFGKCNNGNGHGHNYTWKVVLKGPVDQHTGMVYNLADLKREMNEVLEQVDHKHLDKDVPYFRDNGIVSTTENLSVFLYNELSATMSSPELLHKVVVCETDKNCFSFAGYSS
ncbi:hypothetical protein niasHS_002784 [Heterodera schachtii]|uniref:6-pyruvoyltetrahydropterin synthase n=1 Tax=Heterodera schachtii TaxID=97005 RepID=A0ABD2K2I0_HETSC